MTIKNHSPVNRLQGNFTKQTSIVLCTRCNGTGYEKKVSSYNYRDDDETVEFVHCITCDGDGRMVHIKSETKIYHPNPTEEKVKFVDFNRKDLHQHTHNTVNYRQDKRDYVLEKKYPELAALAYDKYDELLEKLKVIETLKK